MKKGVCVYPGSFDPITNGHLDIIERGAGIFEHVVVAVLHNPAKTGFFSIEQRLGMLRRACAHLPNVSFDCFDGLLMDYMKKQRAAVVLRGLRAITDFENEFQMAQINKTINPALETMFLTSSEKYTFLSSSVVRELAGYGADLSEFLPCEIIDEVLAKAKAGGV